MQFIETLEEVNVNIKNKGQPFKARAATYDVYMCRCSLTIGNKGKEKRESSRGNKRKQNKRNQRKLEKKNQEKCQGTPFALLTEDEVRYW